MTNETFLLRLSILLFWECFVISSRVSFSSSPVFFFFSLGVLFITFSSFHFFKSFPILFPCSSQFLVVFFSDPPLVLFPPLSFPSSQLRTCESFRFCFLCIFGPSRRGRNFLYCHLAVKKTRDWIASKPRPLPSRRTKGGGCLPVTSDWGVTSRVDSGAIRLPRSGSLAVVRAVAPSSLM